MQILVNYWAILVAAIAAYAVGAVWYSPVLFAKSWMQETKREPGQIVASGFSAPVAMVLEFLSTLLMTYILAHFVVLFNATTVPLALELGLWAWFGFVAMHALSGVWFGGQSWKYFAITVGERFVAILVSAAILGAWH